MFDYFFLNSPRACANGQRDSIRAMDYRSVDGRSRSLLRGSLAVNLLFLLLLFATSFRHTGESAPLRLATAVGSAGADSAVRAVGSAGADLAVRCGTDGCACGGVNIGPKTAVPPSWFLTDLTSMYQTSAQLAGYSAPLVGYKARATLVVNVASS